MGQWIAAIGHRPSCWHGGRSILLDEKDTVESISALQSDMPSGACRLADRRNKVDVEISKKLQTPEQNKYEGRLF